MIEIANQKTVMLLNANPATNATSTANIDVRGYDVARITVFNGVTNAATVLKVEHADTTDVTNFSTINATGGTDFSLITNSATTTNPYVVFDLVTAGLKRYLRLSFTPSGAATANVVAIADLGRPLTGIKSATDLAAGTYVTVPGR